LHPRQCSMLQSQHVCGYSEKEDGVHVPQKFEIFLS
jgi:hypothetical protein